MGQNKTKHMLTRRSNAKIIASLIVICFLTVSLNQYAASSEPLNDPIPLCYGFVLPNAILENKTLENEIFCKIRHLVNDLLREDISVYWTSTDIVANVSDINNSGVEYELSFEKGSFIVAFTGNDAIDSKIITIIVDYNQTNEIEESNSKTPVYLLKQQLNFIGRGLTNVKIANYINFLTCGESWFSTIGSRCGFLNFDFFRNFETRRKLKNSNYNLFIWPGFDGYYSSSYSVFEIFLDFPIRRNRAIRDFVYNGGGFVGSCYAGYMAARGIEPFPAYSYETTQNLNLPSIGCLSISDIISSMGTVTIPNLEQQILDTDHPVVYGVDNYIYGGYFFGGPKIVYTGESVNVIAEFKNDSCFEDTPSIVSNKFGDGKVVIFSPHPEYSDPDTSPKKHQDEKPTGTYNGKKLVSNAFFYATSQEETEHEVSETRSISFILDLWNETRDLSDLLNEPENVFEEIKADIDESIQEVEDLIDRMYSILETIEQIAEEENIDPAKINEIFYCGQTVYNINSFKLILEHFEKTYNTLQTIEKLYPLLENNDEFIKQLKQLKNDLSCKISKIQRILSTSSKKLDKMENLLDSYGQYNLFRKKWTKTFKKTSHDVEIQTEYVFQLMPGGYFNSLKLLRYYWYDYEVSIVEN